jgi:hypothetical protein
VVRAPAHHGRRYNVAKLILVPEYYRLHRTPHKPVPITTIHRMATRVVSTLLAPTRPSHAVGSIGAPDTFMIPPAPTDSSGNVLLAAEVSFSWFGEDYVQDPSAPTTSATRSSIKLRSRRTRRRGNRC